MKRVSLVIKLNQGGNHACSLCGKPAEEIQYTGPVLFVEGTDDAVCLRCGEEHAPDLAAFLSEYFGHQSEEQ